MAELHAPEPVPGNDQGPGPQAPSPPQAPPIEDERGPQVPVREPGPTHAPERVASAVSR
jgi:hypothetical protein